MNGTDFPPLSRNGMTMNRIITFFALLIAALRPNMKLRVRPITSPHFTGLLSAWSGVLALTLAASSAHAAPSPQANPSPQASHSDPDGNDAIRIATEGFTGFGGSIVGGVGGLFVGGLIPPGCNFNPEAADDSFNCAPAAVGLISGYLLGATTGIWGAGKAFGAEGKFLWTLAGTVSGAGAALALNYPLIDKPLTDEADTLLALTYVLFPLTGGILGFELSNSTVGQKETHHAQPTAAWMPRSLGVAPAARQDGLMFHALWDL